MILSFQGLHIGGDTMLHPFAPGEVTFEEGHSHGAPEVRTLPASVRLVHANSPDTPAGARRCALHARNMRTHW